MKTKAQLQREARERAARIRNARIWLKCDPGVMGCFTYTDVTMAMKAMNKKFKGKGVSQ
jgi:hypothetical protein